MHEPGPAWLRRELPQPIAATWHHALNTDPIDEYGAAATVEVSLRLVTALQLACLAHAKKPYPPILDAGFERPTLGSWLKLAHDNQKRLRSPPIPELARWPEKPIFDALTRLTNVRNQLAHRGQMTPLTAKTLATELVTLAVDILESLSFLRRYNLFVLLDARPLDRARNVGLVQRFRGPENHPAAESMYWEGELTPHRVYLEPLDGAGADPRKLLDLHPFLIRAVFPDARAESLGLWAGIGKKGDIKVKDDLANLSRFEPRESVSGQLVPFRRHVIPLEKEAATRSDAPSDFAPTLLNRPAESRPFSRRWPIFAALFLIFAVLAATVILLPSNAPPSALPSAPPRLAETSEKPPSDTSPPVETPSLLAPPPPTDSHSPVTCKPSALVGVDWRFDTHILHGDHAGEGVRGHYDAEFQLVSPETLRTRLVKKGYTQNGEFHPSRLRSNDPLSLSTSNCSAAAHLQFTADGPSIANEVRFRMARVGDRLIGLWRHEGVEWDRAHHSGALVGSRANDELPERPDCFLDCVRKCHPGLDPLDAATEKCLIGCAPELERCPADTRR